MHYSDYRCAIGMAEKLREAAAHGDVDRVACLLNENVKPLPDEVWLFTSQIFQVFSQYTHEQNLFNVKNSFM